MIPDDDKPQILHAVDYLSTVSGGGYMGASLVTGLLKDGKFPFTSKFDQMETEGTQHLRDYSNYLAPSGGDGLGRGRGGPAARLADQRAPRLRARVRRLAP